jgi:hypothetical protein
MMYSCLIFFMEDKYFLFYLATEIFVRVNLAVHTSRFVS